MWGTVLFFALITATEPQRMGIAAILVGLRRPVHNLFAFWIGLMTSSFAFAMLGMFVLRDFLIPFTQFLKNAAKSPLVPPAQIAIGVLALSIAVAMVVRSARRQPVPAPVPVLVSVGGPLVWEVIPLTWKTGPTTGASEEPEVPSKKPNLFCGRWRSGLGGPRGAPCLTADR